MWSSCLTQRVHKFHPILGYEKLVFPKTFTVGHDNTELLPKTIDLRYQDQIKLILSFLYAYQPIKMNFHFYL